MRKTICMILVTIMMVCLSGCGGGNDSTFQGTWECFMDSTTYVVQFLEQDGDKLTVNYYSIDFYNSDQYQILDQKEGVVWEVSSDGTVLSSDEKDEIVMDGGLWWSCENEDYSYEKVTNDTPGITEYIKKYHSESVPDYDDSDTDYDTDDLDSDDFDSDDFE